MSSSLRVVIIDTRLVVRLGLWSETTINRSDIMETQYRQKQQSTDQISWRYSIVRNNNQQIRYHGGTLSSETTINRSDIMEAHYRQKQQSTDQISWRHSIVRNNNQQIRYHGDTVSSETTINRSDIMGGTLSSETTINRSDIMEAHYRQKQQSTDQISWRYTIVRNNNQQIRYHGVTVSSETSV